MHKKSGHFKGWTWSLSKGGLSSVQSPSASPSPSSEPSLTQTTSSPACCPSGRRCFEAGSPRIVAQFRSQQKPCRGGFLLFCFSRPLTTEAALCRITILQILFRVIFHNFIPLQMGCQGKWGRSHGFVIRKENKRSEKIRKDNNKGSEMIIKVWKGSERISERIKKDQKLSERIKKGAKKTKKN